MVKLDGLVEKLVVTADGTGQVADAGSALLVGIADRIGLTRALSVAMALARERRSAHDPGVVSPRSAGSSAPFEPSSAEGLGILSSPPCPMTRN